MERQLCMFKEFEKVEKRDFIRERVENYGIQSLMNWEILSFLTGIKQEVLSQYKSFEELKDKLQLLDITRLQKQKLEAIFEVAIRIAKETRKDKVRIQCPQSIADLLMPEMRTLKKEEFRIVLLNIKCEIITIRTISVGSLSSSLVHPREVFKEAVLSSAAAIICVHNHPSGDPTPSRDDIELTKRLAEVGKLMGIEVYDHVIIGDNRYISMKQENLF